MIDFLVIGGGMAGTATAARLAPFGETVLLEKEPALGFHASGRSAAMYEANYGTPSTVALNLASRSHFDQGEYLRPRGFMVLAPSNKSEAFAATCDAFLCRPIPLERAFEMVPILNPAHVAFAAYAQDAHDIDTDRVLQDFAKTARAHGAKIRTGAQVSAIQRSGKHWQVTTTAGSFQARYIINAAGAWADQIAAMAGVPTVGITPKRRSMARVPAPGGHDVSQWPMIVDVEEKWYAKPDAGKWLISPADEDPLAPQDAWADDMVVAEGIARYQPFVTEEVTRVESSWAGLRSFALDGNLVIGPTQVDPTFVWVAGQGGYGIQSAPAYSTLAVDLILGRATEFDEKTRSALHPDRFQ